MEKGIRQTEMILTAIINDKTAIGALDGAEIAKEALNAIKRLQQENEHMRKGLEWLQREVDAANSLDENSIVLDRPEKTKYTIAVSLNFNMSFTK